MTNKFRTHPRQYVECEASLTFVKINAEGMKDSTSWCKFSCVLNSRKMDANKQWVDHNTYYSASVFGNDMTEDVKQLKGGDRILVKGSLTIDEYTNKQGEKVTSPGIKVKSLIFMRSNEEVWGKKEDRQTDSDEAPLPFGGSTDNIIDDDIPF